VSEFVSQQFLAIYDK